MKRVFEIFEEILSIPRESGNECAIANYIIDFAQRHNYECFKDEFHNVFIKKKNNSNKTIILQAHSDMVCVSNIDFDFIQKGIPFFIDGDFYKAHNTSLGADDGIGVAIILAMLEENEDMPNIEVMITVQEETTMLGALNFDYSKLTGKTLISLDGIKEGDIECSSAGMCSLTINKKLAYENNTENVYKILISNLAGGHSGDDIHKNRCNAIKLAGKILEKVESINIVDINFGTRDNVIPNEGYVIFSCKKDITEIKDSINNLGLDLSVEDEGLNISVEKYSSELNLIKSEEIVKFINELEDGLLDVFEDDGFPLLSSNIGKISLDKDLLQIKLSIRSSDKEKENIQLDKLQKLCDKYDFELNIDAKKPFFPFRKDSYIRELLAQTYKGLYNKETEIKKVHACMEGGIISSNIDDLDICTIAPTINNCHSVKESVSISSTKRVYEWLKQTLVEFNKAN